MLWASIAMLMAGLIGRSGPAIALGIVLLLIHLDRLRQTDRKDKLMNIRGRADGDWDGDIDDDE